MASTADTVAAMLEAQRQEHKKLVDALVDANERLRVELARADERSEAQIKALAEYILGWLKIRNHGELTPTFDTMTPDGVERLLGELREILRYGGRPPHWVKR